MQLLLLPWLRSPQMCNDGNEDKQYAAYAGLNENSDGYYYCTAAYDVAYKNEGQRGVRPAFWLSGPEE